MSDEAGIGGEHLFKKSAVFSSSHAPFACIAYNCCMQYTLRKIPNSLDTALRQRAREQGKGLNEVTLEALARGAGVSGERGRQRDLRDIAGTWKSDRAFDRALAAQDTIDAELWQRDWRSTPIATLISAAVTGRCWRQSKLPMKSGCRSSCWGELRAGFAVGSQGPRNEAILRHHGTPIPTNDIAALALQHSLRLCDRDAHFDVLSQLTRV